MKLLLVRHAIAEDTETFNAAGGGSDALRPLTEAGRKKMRKGANRLRSQIKQIDLFGFSVTCSDVFAIGGILSLNLLQEYFGKEAASRAVKVSLLALLFFAVMSQVHLVCAE